MKEKEGVLPRLATVLTFAGHIRRCDSGGYIASSKSRYQ
jgi:hypothetical protein